MKLVANAGELVPSAILDLPLADAAAVPGVREFMDRCCREAAAATVASGSRLRPVFGLTEADVTDADALRRRRCSTSCCRSSRRRRPARPCCRTG